MITIDSTDGVRLAVHELGGEGPPLLFCHATGFHGNVWRGVAAEFPDRRCIAIDFRGYGDSTTQTGPLRWEGFGADVLATVDALELGPVDAIGHSKGGAALLLAEQARPGVLRRVVVFEPIVFPTVIDGDLVVGAPGTANGENPLAASARRRRDRFDSHQDAIDRFGSKPPLGSLRPDVLADYVRFGFAATDDGSVVLKADPEHEAQTYETGASHRAFAHLGEITCPVLVASSGDGGGPAALAPLIAGAIPDAQTHVFDRLTHFGPLEDPVAFAAVARRFLDAD